MAPYIFPAGKLPADVLSRLLDDFGGAPDDVRLGPAVGEDACALNVGDHVVLAATDPITMTSRDIGRYAVIINANDIAVSGARPRWFLATVLLPVGADAEMVESVFAAMRPALDEVGAALVGGHTEVTSAVNQPVIVGQMLGIAEDGRFVTTSGAVPGDVVVQIAAAPVEGAAVLASEASDRLGALSADVLDDALRAAHDPGISVVESALMARDLGATAMHDPTEGGLAAGLHELATAAGTAIRVDRDQVRWFEPGLQVCRALGADPWGTLASGCLLATFAPEQAEAAVDAFRSNDVPAAAIGVVESGAGVHDIDDDAVPWPERDEALRVMGQQR
ncbi:AIR synthase-related protein [Phytoactinopolyspora mesophila]|uniref:Hydrogenase expression protein n=1 Tax=Phytoactinopolyspora mesophila TaxID=2650750 RepID=A0A7K3M7G1_9ACTN|nr:AIR synthase-related protein [Phytoactinopolyspora mesophila]NDL59120.1 hypothetical protein [Phytoactinopolyspora mesophila]